MDSSLQDRLSRFFIFSARLFFALTIFFIPFRWRWMVWQRPFFPIYADYTDFLLFISDLSMLYMLLCWACSLLLFPRKLKAGPALMWLSLVGLTIAAWVSVLGSVDGIFSRYQAVRFILLLMFYLFIVNEVKSAGWVIVPVAAQILFQSGIAVSQVMAQSSLGLQRLGELQLNPADSGVSIVLGEGIRFLRGYGLSDHPNILGGCIAFGLVLLLAVAMFGEGRQPLLASMVFLIAFPALVMTFSRSAWLSLFVAGSFMVGIEAFARKWDSVKRALLLGVLSLLVVMPFIQKYDFLFISRVNSGNVAQDDPMKERAFLLEAGNTLFVEHSAIGIGLGAAPLAMKERFVDFPLNFQPPHYAILVSAMETGVLGGIFYFLLLVIPILTVFFRWDELSRWPALAGAFGLLLALTVVGFFDYYTWSYSYGQAWQWLGWGLYSAAMETTA